MDSSLHFFGIVLALCSFFGVTGLLGFVWSIRAYRAGKGYAVRAGIATLAGALAGLIVFPASFCMLEILPSSVRSLLFALITFAVVGALAGALGGLIIGLPVALLYAYARRKLENASQPSHVPASDLPSSRGLPKEKAGSKKASFRLASRPITVSILLVVGLVPCYTLAMWLGGENSVLPALDDVVSMKTTFPSSSQHQGIPMFQVPESCWGKIYAALSPCNDVWESNIPKWVVLGELTIETKDGTAHYVHMYDLGNDRVGAFSIGRSPTSDGRQYYYGGNSRKLQAALDAAYTEFCRHPATMVPEKASNRR
jgi:hypothetical protein